MEKLTGFTVVIKATNLRGDPVGTSHPSCVYPDEVVTQAKAMRAEGMRYRDISAVLGASISTAHRWVNGKSRKPPVRRIARRVRSESLPTDHQRSSENPASMRPAAQQGSDHTVTMTVTDRS